MALLGNYSVLLKNVGRSFGGPTVSECRAQWVQSGALRGRFCQDGGTGFDAKSGTPDGYRPPGSWVIPIEAGALSSVNLLLGTGAFTASGAMGRNGSAALSGSGSLSGTGALIVSAVAALTGSGAITSASAVAYLNAAAALAGSGSLSAAATALGHAFAALAGSGTASAVPYATGELAADLTPFTELSPQSLAAAVWTSAEGAFLYAVAHNKVVTDPAAGTYTVYDADDVTPLYVADLWADADGTTPYSGSGAERRDRLE